MVFWKKMPQNEDKSTLMTTTYLEEKMLLTLQQEKEKYALLIKHHAEIVMNDTENKGLAATTALLLKHATESLDLSKKYVKLKLLLEDKYKELVKIVVDQKMS
jgi:hypothetical protein